MLRGTLLCAIALVSLVSLCQVDSSNGEVSKEKVPSPEMVATSELLRMEKIKVKYCTQEEIERRKSFCDQVTNEDYRGTCEDLFKQLIRLCSKNMDKILAKTFKRDLYNQYEIIDSVVAPLDGEELRANLEEYFGGEDIHWDDKYSSYDPEYVLEKCHEFIVDYQPVKSVLKYNGMKSLSSVKGLKAAMVGEIFEFCRAFSKHYDDKNQDADLYSDI